jgi:hypothetical protein
MHAQTGRRVQLLGWSQGGGPEPRWALRFWPDIRPMVSKLIDLEAPNHGTVVIRQICSGSGAGAFCANLLCQGHCIPSLWQQADNSMFTAALNSRQETFAGIAYTNVYSHTSQFVQPNLDDSGTTPLHGGGGSIANIATQDICAANIADHLAYYYDPVAYALVIDALTHPGPADPARIDRGACLQLSNPYVPVTEIPGYSAYIYDALFVNRLMQEPQTPAEPPLKCYVTAACPAGSPAPAAPSTATRSCARQLRLPVRQSNGRVVRVKVYVNARRVRTVRARRIMRVTVSRAGRAKLVVRLVAETASGKRFTSVRRYRAC